MGFKCSNTQRLSNFVVSLLLLSILSSTQLRFMSQGRSIPQLKNSVTQQRKISDIDEESKAMVRARIGSRPPRCERRCNSCGHCEAIQVPTNPQQQQQLKFGGTKKHSSLVYNVEYARGDDSSSNYKPMSWKCKCGDFIFNP